MAKRRMRANFEFLDKLGVDKWCFHDRDIAPEGKPLKVGATACASVHLGEIRSGSVRGNHRHHICNETFVVWGDKTVFQIISSIRVVCSLFRDEPHPKEVGSSDNNMQSNCIDEGLEMENQLIVNESLHGQYLEYAEFEKAAESSESSIKEKIREKMEKAFWDSVMESMRKDEPRYSRVVDLMSETRDELCSLAPQGRRQEINEAIDVDILSQLLISSKLDMDYLRKIMIQARGGQVADVLEKERFFSIQLHLWKSFRG